jgi:hypothetical protein
VWWWLATFANSKVEVEVEEKEERRREHSVITGIVG